ncbi:MAG: hypothetical protein QOE45_3433 [Frankiaceae bacterium]|nr:hypothetical protein [Frankiaceae bacterium]
MRFSVLLRAGLAVAAVAALAAPSAANAWTCSPRVRPHTYTVGDHEVAAYEYYMVC